MRIAALVQCEPDAVPNGVQVRGLTDPHLSGYSATHRVDSCDGLAFLGGRPRGLPVDGFHRPALAVSP